MLKKKKNSQTFKKNNNFTCETIKIISQTRSQKQDHATHNTCLLQNISEKSHSIPFQHAK